MLKVNWGLDEAIALFELYAFYNMSTKIKVEDLEDLRRMYLKRAKLLNLEIDNKFRNIDGLNLQLQCIEFVVKGEGYGLGHSAKVFYDVYNLYLYNHKTYIRILADFYKEYN